MDYQAFLTSLTDIGPRFGEKEIQAAAIIKQKLIELNIPFTEQPFSSAVPVCTKAELIVDGESLPCLGSSMVSGQIPDNKYLISHFGYGGDNLPYNLAYNPMTDSLCPVDHYPVPSLTVSRRAVVKIMMAKEVKGRVEVKNLKIDTENILVGNLNYPRNLVFAHFDSIIGPGAVDNAGSVVMMMGCLADNRSLLTNTLFIFSGNEEVAYDEYKRSGYGFRVFEQKYGKLIKNAEQIFVIDGIGIGKPFFTQDNLEWALQLKKLEEIKNRTFWMQNDQTEVLSLFHTKDDTKENIQDRYLSQAEKLLKQRISD